MRTILRTLLAILPFAAASCSDFADHDSPVQPAARMIHVTIGSGPRIDAEVQTRTALDPDGVTVRWVAGDQIALWAEKDGAFALEKHAFSLWHYNEEYNDAKFTADIPQMPEGTYNYYAVSPLPAASNGLKASYDIPAVQSGAYDPACDVMVAEPVSGEALTEGDNTRTVNFSFKHKIHILRITIPTNQMGEDISEIEFEFPVAVTGRMTIDAANPTAAPELTDGSNTLTLRFAQPKKAGDTVYAMIAPVTMTADQTFSVKAVGLTGEAMPNQVPGRNLEAGHTTPILYNVPVMGRHFTLLRFSLNGDGTSTLGEKIDKFTLTAPAGSTFDNGLNVRSFDTNPENNYTLIFRTFTDNLSGKNITVSYDSENALVENSFTMPSIQPESTTHIPAFNVPYLMAEDFSSINQNFGKDDNPAVGGADLSTGDRDVFDLTSFGLSTSGWTGSRIGGQANTAIRICARYEGQSFAQNTYNSRFDSAPLRGIKSGKTVKVSVSYNYKGGRWSVVRKNIFGGDDGTGGNGEARYSYGFTTNQNGMAGSADIENVIASGITLPNTQPSNRTQSQNYSGITYANSFIIPTAANNCRISWKVTTTMSTANFSGCNGNFWLYIDNVKVSITK